MRYTRRSFLKSTAAAAGAVALAAPAILRADEGGDKAGQRKTVALVGPTGAGKTSIANLVARFYEVTDGAVLIDGIDVREVTQQSLRAQMGLVPQDPFLFSGTIADNIRYGRPDAGSRGSHGIRRSGAE